MLTNFFLLSNNFFLSKTAHSNFAHGSLCLVGPWFHTRSLDARFTWLNNSHQKHIFLNTLKLFYLHFGFGK